MPLLLLYYYCHQLSIHNYRDIVNLLGFLDFGGNFEHELTFTLLFRT